MKRIFLVVMMLMIIPSFAQIGKGKKKKEKQNTECVAETCYSDENNNIK
jgi:hypothetical protein